MEKYVVDSVVSMKDDNCIASHGPGSSGLPVLIMKREKFCQLCYTILPTI